MQTMTEKKLRKQLEADLGVNLLPRKDFIRAVVSTSPLCILMNGMHTSCLQQCDHARSTKFL